MKWLSCLARLEFEPAADEILNGPAGDIAAEPPRGRS